MNDSLHPAAASRAATAGRLVLAAVVFVSVIAGFVLVPRAAEQKPKLSVLFIGNSFTYYNDLPAMLARLAQAGGQRPIEFASETPGGCTLEKHWHDGKALALLRSRPWHFVVLQDQSQAALLNRNTMFAYAKKLDAEIRKQGAETMLYMTWAPQDRPQDQPAIGGAYARLAAELRARLAPVGNAWQRAGHFDNRPRLYDADRKHPSPAGSYLAACVLYSTIYGRSPEGLPGSMAGIMPAEALRLQTVAWKSVHEATE